MSVEASAAVLTIGEVAAILRCGVRTIERALASGTFPIAPLPSLGSSLRRRRRLFARVDLLRFVEGRAHEQSNGKARVRRRHLGARECDQPRGVAQGARLPVDSESHRREEDQPGTVTTTPETRGA
jgi:hypothetical protein